MPSANKQAISNCEPLSTHRGDENIVVYADESGSHIPNGERGHEVLVICGFMDLVGNWRSFIDKWNLVLKTYGANYFHFREITYCNREANQYTDWSKEKADDYIYDLAIIAGRSAISIVSARTIDSLNRVHQGDAIKMFEQAFLEFFRAFEDVWGSHLKAHREPVSFVFDQSSNRDWCNSASNVFHDLKKQDSRYGSIAFCDKKNPLTIPLQAADLNAYRVRQVGAISYMPGNGMVNKPNLRILDLILNRNMFPPNHQLSFMQDATDAGLKRLVSVLRADKKLQEAHWREQGTKQIYYPLDHFPWNTYKTDENRI